MPAALNQISGEIYKSPLAPWCPCPETLLHRSLLQALYTSLVLHVLERVIVIHLLHGVLVFNAPKQRQPCAIDAPLMYTKVL
jgi:hypothetical protein